MNTTTKRLLIGGAIMAAVLGAQVAAIHVQAEPVAQVPVATVISQQAETPHFAPPGMKMFNAIPQIQCMKEHGTFIYASEAHCIKVRT